MPLWRELAACTTHKIAMGLVTDSRVPCPDTLMAIIMTPCMRGRSQGSKGGGGVQAGVPLA